MGRLSLIHVDAFTNRIFGGNAAAVCVLSEPCDSLWMQHLARETHLPATVFLWPQETGYSIRWFTPSQELSLCGHGTLAAAHTLWTEGYVPAGQAIALHYQAGELTAERNGEWIEMDFPATRVTPSPAPTNLLQGLGIAPCYVGRSAHSYLVELNSESEVRGLMPDIAAFAQLDTARVIVTGRATGAGFDFVSRFFAPGLGIAEDAVTGSSHCVLAPYWAERLDKKDMVGYQASARGGIVRVRVQGDRVTLGGQAVTVVRGELADGAVQAVG
ncbi:MAG: phenazine biosynthesis protein PhzF family [Chthonomonadaceae bacterium]|nr:phenazine biosynthesis protein PhzF family [Chthonomonadaceae bacterium]